MDKRFSKDGSLNPSRLASETIQQSHGFSDPYLDDDEYSMNMGMERAVNRVMSKSAAPSMSPSLAAAMLSLSWPPEVNKKKSVFKEKSMSFKEGKTSNADLSGNGNRSTPAMKSAQSLKLYGKKKLKGYYIAEQDEANPANAPQEYRPFVIPKFEEVHTAWPGFDHEPIPNWQEKYMIAKPYPKSLQAERSPSYGYSLLSKPSINNNSVTPIDFSDDDEEDEDETVTASKSKSKSKAKATKPGEKAAAEGTGSKPRRRLYVERVGSCIR